MSLQVWLPLTGHLNNQGLSNVTVTNNGATVDNNGKIGKCYAFSSAYIKTTDYANLGDTFSVSFWIYITVASSSVAICTTRKVTYGGLLISTSSGKLTIDSAPASPSSSTRWITSYTIPTNTWTHIVVTRTSTSVSYYVNGEFGASKSTTYANNYGNTLTIGCLNTDGSSYTAYFAGKLNDFRIYNHALSAKEVKELSKGLVLHYPLSDTGIESTTNLITSLTKGGRTTLSADGESITTTGEAADTYFYINTSEAFITNTVYTLSFDVTGLIGTYNWKLNNYDTFTIPVKNGHNIYTFTADSNLNGLVKILFDDGTRPTIVTPITFSHLQLEKKDHATIYAGLGGSRNETTVYDVSGYNNHGIKWSYNTAGSIEIASETPRYNVCTFINSADNSSNTVNGLQYIYGNLALTKPNYLTVAFWLKPLGGYLGQLGQGQFCFTNLDIGTGTASDYQTTPMHNRDLDIDFCNSANTHKIVSFSPTSGWHHYAVIYDGRYGKIYKDGVYQASVDMGSEAALASCKAIVIGFSKAGGVYRKNRSYFSDFRIYTTALSADDVKQLYNTAAALCNNGTLFAYDFVEV